MGKHIHTRYCATARPDIPVHHPFGVFRPFHFQIFFGSPVVFDVVDRGGFAVQDARGSQDRGTSAGREDGFPTCDMGADEFGVCWGEVEGCRVGTAQEECIEGRAGGYSSGGNYGDGAGEEVDGLEGFADMVECECWGGGEGGLGDVHVVGDGVEEGGGARVEEIEGAKDVDGLVVVDEGAEVEGGHSLIVRDGETCGG